MSKCFKFGVYIEVILIIARIQLKIFTDYMYVGKNAHAMMPSLMLAAPLMLCYVMFRRTGKEEY